MFAEQMVLQQDRISGLHDCPASQVNDVAAVVKIRFPVHSTQSVAVDRPKRIDAESLDGHFFARSSLDDTIAGDAQGARLVEAAARHHEQAFGFCSEDL